MSAATDISAVRRFNRFYTRQIGVLAEGLAGSPFSLSEARILYELAHRRHPTAAELARDLDLDAGYLSRMLRRLERQGLLSRRPAPRDGRQSLLDLTKSGHAAFADLDHGQKAQVKAMLTPLTPPDRRRLLAAMTTIETLLHGNHEHDGWLLREHRPVDIGWVLQAHAELYVDGLGWGANFVTLVAEILAKFLKDYDPNRERCFIAERDGVNLGSSFVVKGPKGRAKLRLVIVDPKAHGQGIGKRLVAECIRFAKSAGYRGMMLWTNDCLHAARHIYVAEGFRLAAEEPHADFGIKMTGQTWELDW